QDDKLRKEMRSKERLARNEEEPRIYRLTLDTVDKPNLQLVMYPGKLAETKKSGVPPKAVPEAASDADSDLVAGIGGGDDTKERACKSRRSSRHYGPRLFGITASRCPAKHSDWSSDGDQVEKRNRILLRHADTAVRRRVAWQITSMHSICAVEAHKIMHWRRNKFSARWHAHVRIGIGHDCVSARIDNFPVHARVVASFLLENFECTSLG